MPYLRQNKDLVFTSGREVIAYYGALIDQLISQLQGVTSQDDYQSIRTEIADFRQDLVNQLKNFGHSQVDEYFGQAMATAESHQEYHDLSNAYEELLLAELKRIKEKLHALRTT